MKRTFKLASLFVAVTLVGTALFFNSCKKDQAVTSATEVVGEYHEMGAEFLRVR